MHASVCHEIRRATSKFDTTPGRKNGSKKTTLDPYGTDGRRRATAHARPDGGRRRAPSAAHQRAQAPAIPRAAQRRGPGQRSPARAATGAQATPSSGAPCAHRRAPGRRSPARAHTGLAPQRRAHDARPRARCSVGHPGDARPAVGREGRPSPVRGKRRPRHARSSAGRPLAPALGPRSTRAALRAAPCARATLARAHPGLWRRASGARGSPPPRSSVGRPGDARPRPPRRRAPGDPRPCSPIVVRATLAPALGRPPAPGSGDARAQRGAPGRPSPQRRAPSLALRAAPGPRSRAPQRLAAGRRSPDLAPSSGARARRRATLAQRHARDACPGAGRPACGGPRPCVGTRARRPPHAGRRVTASAVRRRARRGAPRRRAGGRRGLIVGRPRGPALPTPASAARARPPGAACTRMLMGRRARATAQDAGCPTDPRCTTDTRRGRHCLDASTRGATQPARRHPLCGMSYTLHQSDWRRVCSSGA